MPQANSDGEIPSEVWGENAFSSIFYGVHFWRMEKPKFSQAPLGTQWRRDPMSSWLLYARVAAIIVHGMYDDVVPSIRVQPALHNLHLTEYMIV